MAMTRASDLRQPAAVNRPRELQDPLNYYVYHPLARRLARLLVPTPVTPNMVSVMSAVCLCAAAACFVGLAWPENAVTGLFFMLLWHVVDGADGDLARMTGRASATGELVDGVCDYAGNVLMYFAFAFLADDVWGAWAWILAVAAGASHIVQTNHAETQRRLYLWRAYGVPWLRNARAEDDAVFERSSSWFTRYFGFWAVGYLWLSERMTPGANPIDRALVAAHGNPAETERIRATVRASYAPTMWLPMLLGANPKTFLIAGAILAGSPVWFFLAMIGPVNLILLVSILHFRRLGERTAARLSQR
ncbi:CDP-alcohol phosphatidyltransferase family protein [Allosphingosinicella sp.]|uniref:CDP-alcohol phosphatidyltransferase family protein n=1 Tax=Allosphingosinicella sp. TaxID=2823234 RepID=UPI0037850D52